MSAASLPVSDRFWPVFLGCLAIALAEFDAVLSTLLGHAEMAERLDRYWFLGFALSFWLWADNSLSSAKPAGSILGRAPKDCSFLGWLAIAGVLTGSAVVIGADALAPAPWHTLVRGALLGPYLLASCVVAWHAADSAPQTDRGRTRGVNEGASE